MRYFIVVKTLGGNQNTAHECSMLGETVLHLNCELSVIQGLYAISPIIGNIYFDGEIWLIHTQGLESSGKMQLSESAL